MQQQDQMPQGPQAPAPQVKGPSPWQKAVHALLGTQTEYTQTPNGPVPVQVPNKPGNLFRSILAGAILGAGAGTANAEHNAGSGWGAAGAGARAVQENQQKQQQLQAQQAQKQFENQQAAERENREEQVRKAQIASSNAQTLRLNKETQGLDFSQHAQIVAAGKAEVQPYEEAGIHAIASDIPESQMTQYMKDHPGASTLDWVHTGVKTVVGPDGTPSYEYTLSAYDPKGKVSIPPALYSEWQKNGVFDRYPEYGEILKNGKTLTAQQYVQVKGDAEKVMADNQAKNNQTLETTLKQTQIDAARAEIKERQAATWSDSLTAREKQDQLKEKDETETAWTHLAAAGNDPSKAPMTAQDRIALARNAQPLLQDALNAIKVAQADPSQSDKLPELWNNYQSLARLATLGGGAGGGDAAVSAAVSRLKGKTPQEVYQAVSASGATPDQQQAIYKGLGIAPPPSGNTSGKIVVRRSDGSLYETTQAEYDAALANPNPTMSADQYKASVGTVVGPAPPPPTDQQRLATMDLTKGNSY
jgi:hypothetical protein